MTGHNSELLTWVKSSMDQTVLTRTRSEAMPGPYPRPSFGRSASGLRARRVPHQSPAP